MKIAVIGSRGFMDYEFMCEKLEPYKGAELFISGGARGADVLGERWAKENGIPIKIFKPDWDKHGKAAGFIRNKDIIANAELVVAFWDGVSKGTQHSINIARESGKELIIIKP